VKRSTSYRKSMWLGPFPVTDLRPEVELTHLLRVRRHYYLVWNRRHWTDSELVWTLPCVKYIGNTLTADGPRRNLIDIIRQHRAISPIQIFRTAWYPVCYIWCGSLRPAGVQVKSFLLQFAEGSAYTSSSTVVDLSGL